MFAVSGLFSTKSYLYLWPGGNCMRKQCKFTEVKGVPTNTEKEIIEYIVSSFSSPYLSEEDMLRELRYCMVFCSVYRRKIAEKFAIELYRFYNNSGLQQKIG